MKAMEGVKSLDCSPDELPGVEGVERSDGGGGNWGDPPRPDGLRCWCCRNAASYNGATLGKWATGREGSEAAVLPLEPTGQHNPR